VLNGQKMWITNGGFADLYIVFAKIGGEKFSAFIVERSYPGCKPANEEHKMGIHGSSTTPVFLENCKVPKENLLHEIGRVTLSHQHFERWALHARRQRRRRRQHVMMTASKYTKERKAFGKQMANLA